ncbi:helix-turn-helix domain-containing protein [Mycobacterium sp.]|jgi:AcrR family transcriptional regulator|uniref:TetR/AcrR family transcriptional regulator n=1 Tax=Mycobacterium sp. TaxID=1785 RepID=UPI00333EEB65|nr:DNA-binding transcriptional repressor AcrR [Mycobacterium sp.]
MAAAESLADVVAHRRPHRADAVRNFDTLLSAARAAFAEAGTEVSLEEVARRAGVGIATLYRNFPTREDLIECVYVAEVDALCQYGAELVGLDSWTALVHWLRRFVAYLGTKRVLIDGLNGESGAYHSCREALYASGGPLLERAQHAGQARRDVDIDDVMRLLFGVTGGVFRDQAQSDRAFTVIIAGLRAS